MRARQTDRQIDRRRHYNRDTCTRGCEYNKAAFDLAKLKPVSV